VGVKNQSQSGDFPFLISNFSFVISRPFLARGSMKNELKNDKWKIRSSEPDERVHARQDRQECLSYQIFSISNLSDARVQRQVKVPSCTYAI